MIAAKAVMIGWRPRLGVRVVTVLLVAVTVLTAWGSEHGFGLGYDLRNEILTPFSVS